MFSIQGLSNYCLAVIDDFQNLRSRSSWCGYNRESAGIYIYIQTYTYVHTHTHTYIHICSSHRSLLPTHLHTYTPIQSSPRWYLGCDFVFPPLPFVKAAGMPRLFCIKLLFLYIFCLSVVGPGWTQGGCHDVVAHRTLGATLAGRNLTPPPLFFFYNGNITWRA